MITARQLSSAFILTRAHSQESRISSHTQRMGGINDIALSPNQTVVITVGQEKSVTMWDLREALPVQVFSPAHDGEALSIATVHREDGTLFATGGTDQGE